MKKEYLEPKSKNCSFYPSLMDDEVPETTSGNVYTGGEGVDPSGALGNSTNTWEDNNSDVPVKSNVWDIE